MNKYHILYYLLKSIGAVAYFRKLKNFKPVVLCYHRISESKFDSHITYLKKNYTMKPLGALLDEVYSGNRLKKKSIAISMDDCYSNEFANVFNICQKHHVHCTYFVPTGYSENSKSLWSLRLIRFLQKSVLPITFTDFEGKRISLCTEKEKKAFETFWIYKFLFNETQTTDIEENLDSFFIANNTHDCSDPVISGKTIEKYATNALTSFQSHTITHPKLFLCDNSVLIKELLGSKTYLETWTKGQSQFIFCYPYGSAKHIGNSISTVKLIYKYAVTLQSGVIGPSTSPYEIPRIGIYEHDTAKSIMLKIVVSQIKYILSRNKTFKSIF